MKKTLAIMINILILFSMLSSLCACSNHDESKGTDSTECCDTIYSLYYYFEEDTNEILKILSSDNLIEREQELKDKVNDTNWAASALLVYLEELEDDTIITSSEKEDAKENINGITSLIDENLSDLYNNEGSSELVNQFNQSLLANIKYVVGLRFEILDIVILNNMTSQNLISLENLKTKCVCEVSDYITIDK